MLKSEAKKIVRKYAKRLTEANYPFTAVYLFGSHATGQAREWSDIDVAVVSNKLKKDWNKNEELLWILKSDVDPRIEPLGFTEEDYEKGLDPMVAEVKKTGVRIR